MKQIVNVVMLPTNEARKGQIIKGKVKNRYENVFGICCQLNSDEDKMWDKFELYLTSNEEIKEGDWVIEYQKGDEQGTVQQITNEYELAPDIQKKIIATTDKSLTKTILVKDDVEALQYQTNINLPQIPDSFVKAYVESQGSIKEVLVECLGIPVIDGYLGEKKYKPKLRSDNTIIISPSKTYTREDMIAFGTKCGIAGTLAERNKVDYNLLFLELVEQNL